MRNMLVLGATAAFALGVSGAAAYAANPNVPTWSPYALVDVPAMQASVHPVGEGRASLVDPGYGARPPSAPNANYATCPNVMMPERRSRRLARGAISGRSRI